MDFKIIRIKDAHLSYMRIDADENIIILGRKGVRDLKRYIMALNPDSCDNLIIEVGSSTVRMHNDAEFQYVSFWIENEEYIGGTTLSYDFIADLREYLDKEW